MRHYPKAYIEYLVQFHETRDYFECHEIMEEHWKEETESPLRPAWLGLIQTAVALYHERRGNIRGAVKMMSEALIRLKENEWTGLGIDQSALFSMLEERLHTLQQGEAAGTIPAFQDMELPLSDQELHSTCIRECMERDLSWGVPSPLEHEELIHRHKLRDRSGVIRERSRRLSEKMEGRRTSGRSKS